MRRTGVACRSTNSRKSASLTEVDSRACVESATIPMCVRLAASATRAHSSVIRVALPDEFAVVGHLIVGIHDRQILTAVAATDHVGRVIAGREDEIIARTACNMVPPRSTEQRVGAGATAQGVVSRAAEDPIRTGTARYLIV